MNAADSLILIGIISLVAGIVFFCINKKTNPSVKSEDFMKENNFPEEMLKHTQDENTNVLSTNTVRIVKYVNGEKVSDVTETTSTPLPPATYCPNCGAKLDTNTNNTCRYCNSTFIK